MLKRLLKLCACECSCRKRDEFTLMGFYCEDCFRDCVVMENE